MFMFNQSIYILGKKGARCDASELQGMQDLHRLDLKPNHSFVNQTSASLLRRNYFKINNVVFT